MLYRFNRLFNVSQRRALTVCALSFILACCLIPLGVNFASFTASIYVWSLIYGLIWFFKFRRDQKIVTQSKLDSKQEPVKQVIEMTTPGSHRLFPPKPLEDV